jgi:hypothetical protein
MKINPNLISPVCDYTSIKLVFLFRMRTTSITCKPPSNYAPDPAAQYTAQEVKVMLKPYLL